jgi:hypothetical protein
MGKISPTGPKPLLDEPTLSENLVVEKKPVVSLLGGTLLNHAS